MSKCNKPKMGDLISRSFTDFSLDEDYNIIGVPIVFEQPTDIGGLFQETIARDAISENVLKDVAFFVNHDINTIPHARTRNKTMKLTIEPDGVHMWAKVNRERSDSNDVCLAIKDGNIDGMSFMFRIEKDEWEDRDTDYPKRRITKIGYVQEVSAVTYPAYKGTSIYARASLSLDKDKKALDEARAAMVDTVVSKKKLELEKLKALYLYC